MTKLEVFDPAMCCSTGVCGAEVDPRLPQFAADLEWVAQQGVQVARYNLAQDIEKVRSALAARVAIVPWMLEEPRGTEALRRFLRVMPAS